MTRVIIAICLAVMAVSGQKRRKRKGGERTVIVVSDYERGYKAAKYVLEENFNFIELIEFLNRYEHWHGEQGRQEFFDGFWTGFNR